MDDPVMRYAATLPLPALESFVAVVRAVAAGDGLQSALERHAVDAGLPPDVAADLLTIAYPRRQ